MPKHLLIVDDTEATAKALCDSLSEQLGEEYRCTYVTSIDGARASLARNAPDIVVSDYYLGNTASQNQNPGEHLINDLISNIRDAGKRSGKPVGLVVLTNSDLYGVAEQYTVNPMAQKPIKQMFAPLTHAPFPVTLLQKTAGLPDIAAAVKGMAHKLESKGSMHERAG